jgi:hypothetical protein
MHESQAEFPTGGGSIPRPVLASPRSVCLKKMVYPRVNIMAEVERERKMKYSEPSFYY